MFYDGFYVYPGGADFGERCRDLLLAKGLKEWPRPEGTLFSLAPRLTRRLSKEELNLPLWGTLIFHPSILPYLRGPDAIRWSMARGEHVSGVTWFWAEDGLDTGQICEQESVLIDYSMSAGRNYHTRFIPAGLRALERALTGIAAGRPRRVPQEEHLATYETFLGQGSQSCTV